MNNIKNSLNQIISVFDFKLNKNIERIMKIGIKLSFILTLFSTLIMSLYITSNPSYIVYDLGTSLFKASTTFITAFIIYAIVFNKILKDIT